VKVNELEKSRESSILDREVSWICEMTRYASYVITCIRL
jgi:hypothetical protein